MSKIKSFILEQVLPGFHAGRSNRKVESIYESRKDFEVDLTAIGSWREKEYIEQIKLDLKQQHERKKIIEDKVKSLLFIIAVSITAITFSLNYLQSITYNSYQIIALFFLGVSVLYFVQGVVRALQVLNIRQFHIVQAEVEITEKNYRLLAKKSDSSFLRELIKSKQQNDLINIRLSNYAFASFNLIRNGVIFFVVFFAVTVVGDYFSKKIKIQEKYSIKKEVKVKISDSVDVKIPYAFELIYDIKKENK